MKTLIKSTDIFKLSELTFWQTKELYRIVGYVTSEHALKHPDVQRLLHADNLHYDLILTEQYYQDALLLFAHKFQAPMVSICKLKKQ